jgi:SAM-dependent methyltransferase
VGVQRELWLLVRGRGDRRLSPDVGAADLVAHSSTRRPSVQRGDLALCYAAGWQSIFAVVEVASDPENDPTRTRWQWRFALRPIAVLADLRAAPPVEAAGVFPRSLGRHSYVRLTPEQFDAGRAAIGKRLVEAGYDVVAERYREWQRSIVGSRRFEWLERLLALLPERPDILELGVGQGVRATRTLAERGRLVGVDISREQLRRARERLPAGVELIHADFAELGFRSASFDAVAAFYVLNHVPRGELGPLLRRVAGWLRPGGALLATFGASDTHDAVQDDWLGAPMFFAAFPPETNLRLVADAGLELVAEEIETIVEPGEGARRFHWILARKPPPDSST